jgi:hypothetical protein
MPAGSPAATDPRQCLEAPARQTSDHAGRREQRQHERDVARVDRHHGKQLRERPESLHGLVQSSQEGDWHCKQVAMARTTVAAAREELRISDPESESTIDLSTIHLD